MKAIAVAVGALIAPVQMMIATHFPNLQLLEAIRQQKIIEEEGLEQVYLSCYLPTGNKTADGTVPYEGICSCNYEHLGQDCIMYDAKTLTPVARWECRDVGGNSLLKQGKAIDVYRDSMERALQLREEYGYYVYIKWVDREDSSPDTF